MSTSSVAGRTSGNVRRTSRNVGQRARRALLTSGLLALALGGALGYVHANPEMLNTLLTSLLEAAFGALGLGPQALAPWLRLPVSIHPVAAALAGMALTGLLCGALVGLWLSGTSGLLRALMGILAVLVGLISAEIVRGLLLGQAPTAALSQTRDSLEALQLGVGALGALIGVRTGRQPEFAYQPSRREQRPARPARPTTSSSGGPVARVQRSIGSIRMPSLPSIRLSNIRLPGVRSSRHSTRSGRSPVTAQPDTNATLQIAPPAPTRQRRRGNRKLSRRRAHNVHLGRETTGVCPYCLEEVAPNDPRGRVVCDICGSPHHADCWSITGKCEVPHLQS